MSAQQTLKIRDRLEDRWFLALCMGYTSAKWIIAAELSRMGIQL